MISKMSMIASSACGIDPVDTCIVRFSPSNTAADSNNARLEKSDGIVKVVAL